MAGDVDLGSTIFSLRLTNAAFGRPISRDADAFGYAVRGEVPNATISATSYVYAYDEIGNRTAATAGAAALANAANALNEYTAATGETPSDDADGNLLRRGDKNLTWDACGRLSKASPDLVSRWQNWWEYEYDRLGRRTTKRRMVFFGGWAPPDEIDCFFYDGWNPAHQIHVDASYQVSHIDFFWGPDLSGTLQGAGGVGGLVAVSIGGDFYFPGYDNNGNVVGYWDESGSLVAEYAYDAFGNTISSSGSMSSVFPHRFSTKYYDAETDLYYYGYRYYSPSLGRWISRDPIGEEGGNNLYSIAENNCLSVFDILGERNGDWPDSSAEDGWAFAGDMNYPGPGWSGTFRTRPTTNFDLVAKIHDLHYALNGLSFGFLANTIGHAAPQWSHWQWRGQSAELSRKAKADYIFKMMNKLHWEGGRWSGILNFLSRQVFYDDPKYFCKGDDFANFLLQPESWQLDDPSHLLMIPYSQLSSPPTRNHLQTLSFSVGGSKGGNRTLTRSVIEMVPDFLAEVPEDRNPGFLHWMQLNMPDVLSRVYSITDQTDSSFVW